MALIWTAVTSLLISLALVKNARVVAEAAGTGAAAVVVAGMAAAAGVVVVSVATGVLDGTESSILSGHASTKKPAHHSACWNTHPIESKTTRTIVDGHGSVPVVRLAISFIQKLNATIPKIPTSRTSSSPK